MRIPPWPTEQNKLELDVGKERERDQVVKREGGGKIVFI
jgi:hypothetical protein